jgi:hypothetical protein
MIEAGRPEGRAWWLGAALIATPVLLQVPFSLLASRFDYPGILREPAAVILTRFREGGPGLVAIWYAFAIAGLPLVAAMIALPRALSLRRAQIATALGVASALLQVAALLRWTFVVPALAELHAAGDPGAAAAFVALHQYAGVALGEHLGQLLLAGWTVGIALEVRPRWLRGLGMGTAALFLVGLGEPFAPELKMVPVVAFLGWSVFVIGLGIEVLRLRPASSPPSGALAAR